MTEEARHPVLPAALRLTVRGGLAGEWARGRLPAGPVIARSVVAFHAIKLAGVVVNLIAFPPCGPRRAALTRRRHHPDHQPGR